MSDQKLDWQEAQSKRDRENAAALADLGLTPSEASLFNVLHFGLTVPPQDLCRRAAYRDYSIGGRVTEEQNQLALDECFGKGWLQVVDEASLDRIHDEVRREQLLGPVYDYPAVGGVDFTLDGAEQWFRICDRLWEGGSAKTSAYCDVVHEKSSYYFCSKSKAVAERDRRKEWESVVSIKGPIPIGPWRANWWRWFPEGYRIDIEERMQWQGRGSSNGGSIFFPPINVREITRAKDVLDRHNLTWREWLVLTSLEHATDRRRIVWQAVETSKRFGVQLTEAEVLHGLETCLQFGWICEVDEQVDCEIIRLVSADTAFMPVPFDPVKCWREVDFTTEGALLYRMVSAEIYGPDWEEALLVEDTYYREEHRYCATEAGLATVNREYADSDETPKTIDTIRIGPWCVYWWERFPSGYRVELTFGN